MSEELAQGPYVAVKVVLEPATCDVNLTFLSYFYRISKFI